MDDCNIRGGSFKSGQAALTCTNRAQLARSTSTNDVGVRCCL